MKQYDYAKRTVVPNGKYIGDLFFITNEKNEIIIALQWTGDRWAHEFETFTVGNSDNKPVIKINKV